MYIKKVFLSFLHGCRIKLENLQSEQRGTDFKVICKAFFYNRDMYIKHTRDAPIRATFINHIV